MELERKAFMALIRTKESQARIKSIIDTGKPSAQLKGKQPLF